LRRFSSKLKSNRSPSSRAKSIGHETTSAEKREWQNDEETTNPAIAESAVHYLPGNWAGWTSALAASQQPILPFVAKCSALPKEEGTAFLHRR
jgi:hypothetical protein